MPAFESLNLNYNVQTEEQPTPSLGEVWEANRELDSTFRAVDRMRQSREIARDPEYRLEDMDTYLGEVPAPARHLLSKSLSSSTSAEQSRFITDRFKTELEQNQVIASAGGIGMATRFAANIVDEGAFALSLFTGPLAAGAKMTRMAAAMRGAGILTAESLAAEGILMAGSETMTPADLAIAALPAAALGGLVGAVSKTGRLDPADPNSLAGDVHVQRNVPAKASDLQHRYDDALKRDMAGEPLADVHPGLQAHADAVEDVIAPGAPKGSPEDVAPPVRPKAESTAETVVNERAIEIDAEIEKLRKTDLPPPQKSQLLEKINMVEVLLQNYRRVMAGTNKVEQTRASQALQAIQETVVRTFQKEAPDEFAAAKHVTVGMDRNAFLEWAMGPGRSKIAPKLNKAWVKASKKWEKEVDALDAKIAELKAERVALADLAPADDGLKSVGAAQAGSEAKDLSNIDEEMYETIWDVPRTAFRNFRYGAHAILDRSGNPFVRWLNYVLTSDAVGKVGHALNPQSAEALAKRHLQITQTKQARTIQEAFRAWKIEKGIKEPDVLGNQNRQFNAELTDAMEFGTTSPALKKAAAETAELYKDTFEFAKRAGVKGFSEFEWRPDYVPRIASADKFQEVAQNLRMANAGIDGLDGPIQHLLFKALKLAQPEADDAILKRIAKGYERNTRNRAAGVGGRFADLNRSVDPEHLREILEASELDDDAIDYMIGIMTGSSKKAQETAPARARKRLLMDLEAEIEVVSKETGETDILRLADMFERDATKLSTNYARSIGGLAAIAQRTKGTPIHVRSLNDLEKLKTHARRYESELPKRRNRWASASAKGAGKEAIDAEIDILEQAINGIIGRPINDPASVYTTARRTVGDWNYMTSMGMVAFSQFAELGPVMSEIGIKNMMAMMPEYKAMMTRRADGLLNHPLARVAEEWLGAGTELLRGRTNHAWTMDPEVVGKGMSGYEGITHHIKNAVSLPMRGMMTGQQRILAVHMLQDFSDIAKKGKKLSKAKLNRLATEGIDEDMLARISEQYKKATYRPDSPGKLVDPNFDQWDDMDARDALLGAMFSMGRRAVQENDIGNSNPFIQRNLGAMLFQFRTFVLGAWEKHLLHGIHHADMQTFANMSLSMLMASAGYSAQTYWKTVGMDERQQKKVLRDRLSMEEVAKASFSRATWSSFIPGLIDSAGYLAGYEEIFNHRGSGYSQNFITGNPTVALLDRTTNAGRGVLSAITRSDYDFSQKNAKDIQYSLPGATLPGLQQLWNLSTSGLPKYSE